MTIDEAEELWDQARDCMDQLRESFPCGECDGTGDLNSERDPYPEICEECWGRGFVIPEGGE